MKKLVSLLLSLLMLVSLSLPAFADFANNPAQTEITAIRLRIRVIPAYMLTIWVSEYPFFSK